MQAVIIAAGAGSRLTGDNESKPLTNVSGVALIERAINQIVMAGVNEVLVVTGYQAEMLEEFLARLSERTQIEIRTHRLDEWTKPNGHSVLAAARLIDGPYLLAMSDHICDPQLISGLLDRGAPESGLVLAVDYQLGRPTIDINDATKVYCPDRRQIEFIGKEISNYNAIDTGFFLATPSLRETLEKLCTQEECISLSNAVQRLANCGQAYVHDIGAHWWIDVDDLRMLAIAETLIKEQHPII